MKMSKLATLVGAGLLSLSTAQASLLYKISGNEMQEPSYLFGTIHLICAEDFKVAESTQAALQESDRVILELDMDDAEAMQAMQTKLMDPEGNKISAHLSEDQQAMLDAFLMNNFGAGLAAFDGMRPFILSTMVMTTQMGCAQQMSFEGYFVQQAMGQGKSVDGLETVDFQFGVFEQIPHQEQVQWLIESLEQPDKAKEEFAKMLELYLAEDSQGLYDMIAGMDAYAEYTELLLDNRNRDWQTKLDAELQAEGSEFIAVGAGHLGGEAGVVQLLRDLGYDVEPIATSAE
jgi:uncharacterized protein YbaP (TraB family)